MRSTLLSTFLFIFPFSVFAGWQVTPPAAVVPHEPFFQTGAPAKPVFVPPPYASKIFPNKFVQIGPPAPMYAISMCGSLKENLERILGRYKWRLVWKAPYDYNFDGRITGSSLPNAIERLLKPFPLQAVMYMSNRTVAVVPRFKA